MAQDDNTQTQLANIFNMLKQKRNPASEDQDPSQLTDVPENLIKSNPNDMSPNYGIPQQPQNSQPNWSDVPENLVGQQNTPLDVSSILNRSPNSLNSNSLNDAEKTEMFNSLRQRSEELPPSYGFPKINRNIKHGPVSKAEFYPDGSIKAIHHDTSQSKDDEK